jgi:RNA polymerase sigma-70 factor, ECF subfamily
LFASRKQSRRSGRISDTAPENLSEGSVVAKKRDADILACIAKAQELARERDEQGARDYFLGALFMLVQDYKDYIFRRFCRRLSMQHHAIAEELTQDIFLRMYDYMGRWKPEESISDVLYRHFRWRFLDFLKTLKRKGQHQDIYNSEWEREGPTPKPEETDLLNRAINQLRPAEREFLFECYSEDKTLEEVAKEHGIGTDSARRRLERIVARLEKLMESLERESDVAEEGTKPRRVI